MTGDEEVVAAVVEVDRLSKRFGSFSALENLSFRLGTGESLGLLGVNGAGKTTAMNLLLGLLLPSGGTVRFFGQDFRENRIGILQRCNFSSAYTNLPSNLRVWQNLLVFAKIYGVKSPRHKIGELLDLFEIGELSDRVTGHLSSGEATRVNLCKALLNDPEVLLLDEPTASLDPDIADKVRRAIRHIQVEKGTSIIYTSHNMRDVEEVCDRILFMHRGRVLAEGTPREVVDRFQEKNLEHLFIRLARSGEVELDVKPVGEGLDEGAKA